MAFNTAVSGLRAASDALSVIGNNVANASTTGFKQSRANFADVYAASALGTGRNTIGSGVLLSQVSQQFSQGNISFTNNGMDMAINGNGFFVVDNAGATEYSRAGVFGLDARGNIVSANGSQLQGFPAVDGQISQTVSNLSVDSANLDPSQTTSVEADLNLDATEVAPAVVGTTYTTDGDAIGDVAAGGSNNYPAEEVTFTLADNTTRTVTTLADASAAESASLFSQVAGVTANPHTIATLSNVADNGGLVLSLNGVAVVDSADFASAITAQDIAIAINRLTSTTLPGITAINDNTAGTVTVTSNTGVNLTWQVTNSGDPLDAITVAGATPRIIQLQGDGLGDTDTDGNGAIDGGEVGNDNGGFNATVGGSIDFVLDEDITMSSVQGDLVTDDGSGLFAQDIVQVAFIENSFDPDDQDTYNHATSVNVFDSLGISHVMNMYFVKETDIREWTMYVQIDGNDVGDPNPALPAPENETATRAAFNLIYNNDGSLDPTSDPIEISYWRPFNSLGQANGAMDPLTRAQRDAMEASGQVVDPLTISNFNIDLDESTQYGAPFAVSDMAQDGYSVGRLADVDITSEGYIFTRFTNGQSKILGQVALANFNNPQGLQPLGNSTWSVTFESGEPLLGAPNTAALGVVQSGALEESNVDLSQELVGLIIAQRNFQANAKTIQTADAVTQSIINLR